MHEGRKIENQHFRWAAACAGSNDSMLQTKVDSRTPRGPTPHTDVENIWQRGVSWCAHDHPINYYQCWLLGARLSTPSTLSHYPESNNDHGGGHNHGNHSNNPNNDNDFLLYSSLWLKDLGGFHEAARVGKGHNRALLTVIVMIFTGAKQKVNIALAGKRLGTKWRTEGKCYLEVRTKAMLTFFEFV